MYFVDILYIIYHHARQRFLCWNVCWLKLDLGEIQLIYCQWGAYLQSILMFWLVALLLSVFVLLLLLSLSLWLSLWLLLLLLLLLLLAAAVAATTTTAATTAATTTTTICPFASRLSVGVVLSAVMFGHFYIMSLGWTLFRWGGWSGACNHPTGTRTGLLRWVPLLLHASLMIPRSEREWLYTRIGMLQKLPSFKNTRKTGS